MFIVLELKSFESMRHGECHIICLLFLYLKQFYEMEFSYIFVDAKKKEISFLILK